MRIQHPTREVEDWICKSQKFTLPDEQRWSNPKVVGSIPTVVRVILCPCVGPFPLVGLTLTWFIWGTKLALHVTL